MQGDRFNNARLVELAMGIFNKAMFHKSLQIIDHTFSKINLPTNHETQNQSYPDQVGNLLNLLGRYWCREG